MASPVAARPLRSASPRTASARPTRPNAVPIAAAPSRLGRHPATQCGVGHRLQRPAGRGGIASRAPLSRARCRSSAGSRASISACSASGATSPAASRRASASHHRMPPRWLARCQLVQRLAPPLQADHPRHRLRDDLRDARELVVEQGQSQQRVAPVGGREQRAQISVRIVPPHLVEQVGGPVLVRHAGFHLHQGDATYGAVGFRRAHPWSSTSGGTREQRCMAATTRAWHAVDAAEAMTAFGVGPEWPRRSRGNGSAGPARAQPPAGPASTHRPRPAGRTDPQSADLRSPRVRTRRDGARVTASTPWSSWPWSWSTP